MIRKLLLYEEVAELFTVLLRREIFRLTLSQGRHFGYQTFTTPLAQHSGRWGEGNQLYGFISIDQTASQRFQVQGEFQL
jgi:hypothetical protein